MKKIDFDNDSIKKNILQAALPMLAAQILSLLYNIVDRIYIARIPDMGTTALGAVGLCFPIIMLTIAFSNLFGSGGAPLFSIKRGMSDDRARQYYNEYELYNGLHIRSRFYSFVHDFCKASFNRVWRI